jgi:hypothetical protein
MFAQEFNGYVDAINRFEVCGWALNKEKSSEPLEVELYVDGNLLNNLGELWLWTTIWRHLRVVFCILPGLIEKLPKKHSFLIYYP